MGETEPKSLKITLEGMVGQALENLGASILMVDNRPPTLEEIQDEYYCAQGIDPEEARELLSGS